METKGSSPLTVMKQFYRGDTWLPSKMFVAWNKRSKNSQNECGLRTSQLRRKNKGSARHFCLTYQHGTRSSAISEADASPLDDCRIRIGRHRCFLRDCDLADAQ